MQLYWKSFDYDDDADVLVRAYDNQQSHDKEDELFIGEILFRRGMGRKCIGFAAPYPAGLAEGITIALTKFKDKNWKVQISNEIPAAVEHLTSCDQHFELRFKDNWVD